MRPSMPKEIAKWIGVLASAHCKTVWSPIFDVLVGWPSFAIASAWVDMPGTSSVTL